ncbi:plasmid maintenance protein [Borreliella valaisiana]|uniref:plasmid maintenance protein n=1 Tax=Borreliella valaisiana TaxID=62088 RepID=UPI001AEF7CEC|nr:plasmid maintenance protein [Borreliella valaisiana]
MIGFSNNIKNPNYPNKHQHKLIVLISTLEYINKKYQKYTQKNIFYYFNENLKRNDQPPVKLKTLQKYLYKLEKEIKVTTNYYKHLGVNLGTEIYYKLNFSKKECYQKINKYFTEKKLSRFKSRVNNSLKNKFIQGGNVTLGECINNKNNKIRERTNNNLTEKYQIKNYYNKCNFLSKKTFSILNLDINKDKLIDVLKIIKRIEISLTKNKSNNLNRNFLKEKQKQLKEILNKTEKQLRKKRYDNNQLKNHIQKIYENYKFKPHFIIENQKYKDLNKIKRKLEKSIEIKKENSQQNYQNLKINIFNILIEQLKKNTSIEILKPIVRNYLNSKDKLKYNEVFDTYCCELLELIKNKKIFQC